jgi:hypothetical protein
LRNAAANTHGSSPLHTQSIPNKVSHARDRPRNVVR